MIYRSNSLFPILSDILSGKIQNILILTGAGISVSSGIPDFRSANGLYKTLKSELLTATESQKAAIKDDPTLVVDYSLFRANQFPYLEVRRNLILGIAERKWKPTLGHYFMKILNDKQLLLRLYTQNIDGIDYQLNLVPKEKQLQPSPPAVFEEKYESKEEEELMKAALPKRKEPKAILNVHGTLHEIECEHCHDKSYSLEEFCTEIKHKIKNIYDPNDPIAPKESSQILCKKCLRPQVKPSTVMFGRSLPSDVFTYIENDCQKVDLMIVIGTSLQVSPANFFVTQVPKNTPRLVINKEMVGEELGLNFGPISECNDQDFHQYLQSQQSNERNDAILLGDGDECILYLLKQLNWLNEIRNYENGLCPSSLELLNQSLSK